MGAFSGIALYNNPGMKYLLQPQYKVLRHAIYIGLIFLFWAMFDLRELGKGIIPVLQLIGYSTTYVVIIYFNFIVLMPRYLYQNKIWAYLLITYATFLAGYVTQEAIYFKGWEELAEDYPTWWLFVRNLIINGFTFIMFCCIGWSFRMFKMWLNGEHKIVELENQKLHAELNNLKHQVNPHFLFNTFNSLYVTSKTSPAAVPEMILDLADLMRYQLEECSKEKVSLKNEIEYIKNFLGIERVRKDNANIKLEVDEMPNDIMVEPLLFIPLVENAFKHGLSKMEKGYVFISFSTRNREKVYLKVENSKPVLPTNGKSPGYGIGLSNLSKRLQLSYPGRHKLEITDTTEVFTAYLELQLE